AWRARSPPPRRGAPAPGLIPDAGPAHHLHYTNWSLTRSPKAERPFAFRRSFEYHDREASGALFLSKGVAMSWHQRTLLTVAFLLPLLCSPDTGAQPGPPSADELALTQAKVGTDAPALLAFLRQCTPQSLDPVKTRALVERLGSKRFREREGAEME